MKRIVIVIATSFVAVAVGGFLLREHEQRSLLARAVPDERATPASPPKTTDIALVSSATPPGEAGTPTWDEFNTRWQAALEARRVGVPRADAAASQQVAAAMERLSAAFERVHLTEIAAGKRSRLFIADTETLLAATRPRPGDCSAEAVQAAAELQSVLAWLADPARPDLGLVQAATNLLVGEGPPQYPSVVRPYASDLTRFAEDIKRVLIYTSMPIAEVLRATDELHALLQGRLERALAYDQQLVRAIELARVATQCRENEVAKRALDARLYSPLEEVIQLVALDVDDWLARGIALTRAQALDRVEYCWGWEDKPLNDWLLTQRTGDIRDDFLARRSAERHARNEPSPSPLPQHLQEVLDGVQRDREAAGLEPRKRRSSARGIEEQFKQLMEQPNPFAAAPGGRQQRN